MSDIDTPSAKRLKKDNSSPYIPTSSHYQVSFLHRSVITFIVSSPKHGYVITCSNDGVVKFWKRTLTTTAGVTEKGKDNILTPCLEFVKAYTAHVGPINSLAISSVDGGDTAASIGEDGFIKLYDVSTFDVRGMIRTSEKTFGTEAVFVGKEQLHLAVSSQKNEIWIFDIKTCESAPIQKLTFHACNISVLAYHPSTHCGISCDVKGIIEIWECVVQQDNTLNASPPSSPKIQYKSKFDTDLYHFMKQKTYALAVCTSADHFAVYGHDRKIRVFDFRTGKFVITYDERLSYYDDLQNKPTASLDAIEYGKRAATEREMGDTRIFHLDQDSVLSQECGNQCLVMSFDPSGRYLLYSTLLGIKVVDIKNHKCIGILGSADAAVYRFLSVCFFFSTSSDAVDTQMLLARGIALPRSSEEDSFASSVTILANAYKKKRFFVFTSIDPVEDSTDDQNPETALVSRDILNEPPDNDDVLASSLLTSRDETATVGKEAVLRTTMGDIHIKLFYKECPRTIENFCTHAKNGYYDDVIFHRIIKGFMIQTGDPLGDGTGGESIWGGEFEDEFVRDLRHDRPFTVSMANAGPNTNGSQFFITTVPTPWLDNKHTVFGRVVKGMDVCLSIENVTTDDSDKPLKEISIVSVDIL